MITIDFIIYLSIYLFTHLYMLHYYLFMGCCCWVVFFLGGGGGGGLTRVQVNAKETKRADNYSTVWKQSIMPGFWSLSQ